MICNFFQKNPDMKRRILLENICDLKADVLIYSTNIDLRLRGGVGAALLKKYGHEIQEKLFYTIDKTGRKIADIGEVLECTVASMPWKTVFHTVATNEMYETQAETVRSILNYCLNKCVDKGDIKSVVTSALGCGWGDLLHSDFIDIATDITDNPIFSKIDEFIVCCDNQIFYNQLCESASRHDPKWEVYK